MSESASSKNRKQIKKLLKLNDKEMLDLIEIVRTEYTDEIKGYPFKTRIVIAWQILKGSKKQK